MLYNSCSDHNSSMDSLSPPSSSATRQRGSTSQMCLHRILTTIATVPPPAPLPTAKSSLLIPEDEKTNAGDDTRCLSKCSRFDLNSPEAKESLSSTSSTGGVSDVDHEYGGDRTMRRLSLLIEAATLIFGEFVDGDKSELKNGVTAEIGGELDETPPSPVGRSNRGRTRVLPCRYRDSVLEPLTRSGSTVLPAKRRRR